MTSINLEKLRNSSSEQLSIVSKWIDSLVRFFLVLSFSSMCLLSLISIVCRWSNHSILWVDPVVRHLILVISFLGAYLAILEDKNIKIELFKDKLNFSFITRALSLINFFVCVFLFYGGYQFFLTEKEFGKIEFLGLHSSLLVFIVPLGFCLLSFKFFTKIFEPKVKIES